jgi:hypothetical protein
VTPVLLLVAPLVSDRRVPEWLRETWSTRLEASPTQIVDVAEALGDVLRYADAPADVSGPLAELVWIASQSGGDPFVTVFVRDTANLLDDMGRYGPAPTRRMELAMARDRLESLWRFLALLPPVGHVVRAREARVAQQESDERLLSRVGQRKGAKAPRALSLPRCAVSQQREGKQWWNQ